MNSTEENLLKVLFYSPSTSTTSIQKLYDKVKHRGISLKQVRDFVNRQEAHQLYKHHKRIKHYFPIVAKRKFEILQIDLADLSDIASANKGIKYLLVCVDVFSRFALVTPLINKTAKLIIPAMNEIINLTHVKIINCDNGSEWTSKEFKKLTNNHNVEIKYVEVGDHHKLGIVDRFIRTLRESINKYMILQNTTKYIDALPDIVYNYNNSLNRGVKAKPNEVKDEDKNIIALTNQKYNKALQEEIKFNISDRVRHIVNKKTFDKGSLPKWSKTIHTIVDKSGHMYKLDNGKLYKYYELQKVNEVEQIPIVRTTKTRESMRNENRIMRNIKRTGIDLDTVVYDKRSRKQPDFYKP